MTALRLTSRDNPLVREAAGLLSSPAARREAGAFLCEGPVLLAEALRSGARVRRVFCREALLPALPPLDCPVHPVSEPVLKKLSDVPAPQGLVFVCALPEPRDFPPGPLLALDEVRDPGNLGTIIRTADAFGAAGVALLGDCADPFAPKVVRATMGSLFRVPLRRCTAGELRARPGPLLALDEVRDPGNLGTIIRTADAFGAAGVALLGDCADPFAPKVVRATMGSLFRVPLRRCTAGELRARPGPLLAAVLDGDSRPIGGVPLRDACVVIGNEAHGVSPAVRACCGGAVNIPIRGAESLNAAVAASIFLYEMARQRG